MAKTWRNRSSTFSLKGFDEFYEKLEKALSDKEISLRKEIDGKKNEINIFYLSILFIILFIVANVPGKINIISMKKGLLLM